ncbi:hypothetical protein KVR01_000738 [Diaporthe batatas]|uniref:uncharacterized protein n=1 Tax=Diaporthe batatas TaxID=748121 RepID=UPI001D043C7D|nr:uncharacterized protein KVR01_000738 [Diaporthe batatas]KAG8169993.1 hypothetical protein KVR01_000738 [Diaporthe batatas]
MPLADVQEARDAVAIIGMACRFPGEATCPSKFWDLLKNGQDAFSADTDRYNIPGFYHANSGGRQNVIPHQGGHFLKEDPFAFDAAFFNITPAEAAASDPRQRLALEVAYEAFENSGLNLQKVAGTKTACFMGSAANMGDYKDGIARDFGNQPQHLIMGISEELMSNRLSHFFDLHGPSVTVETACSSSLVAVHLACQSLRSGETTVCTTPRPHFPLQIIYVLYALTLSPDTSMQLHNLSVLSPEGRSRSFDEKGGGYGRGEGCGVVVLKLLSAALRDGDPIRSGMAMPSGASQAQLIKDVYQSEGLEYGSTQYIEAHGTGTKAGDPTEAKAIYSTIGQGATKTHKLIMGSVKPNIGHLEPAAGIAGLIKGVLALEHGLIPPNIHLSELNQKIPLDEWNMAVPTSLTPWPVCKTRRMSISSFGLGGTNAHLVVEARQPDQPGQTNGHIRPAHQILASDTVGQSVTSRKRLFVFSAQDRAGFVRIGQSLVEHLDSLGPCASTPEYLADLAHTLALARSGLAWKGSCLAESAAELVEQLSTGLDEHVTRDPRKHPRIAFVFTGQGAQWAGMGVEMLGRPVFMAAIAKSASILRELGCDWDPVTELRRAEDESRLRQAEISQPICTVLQIALVEELRSWGVKPEKVVGHSSGEIAAAYCLGALTHRDAIMAAYFRGKASARLQTLMPGQDGAMMAVACSREQAQQLISEHDTGGGQVTVACVNSPNSVTLSGCAAALANFSEILRERKILARRLKVDVPYHSPLMNAISEEYSTSISSIVPRNVVDESISMISSLTGSEVAAGMLGPYYWLGNLLSPVLFSDAVRELTRPSDSAKAENTVDMFIEVGPHSTLAGPVEQILDHYHLGNVPYKSVLLRGRNSSETSLQLGQELFHQGTQLIMEQVNGDLDCRLLTDLPPYPWKHDRKYDATSRLQKEYLRRQFPTRSLIGAKMPMMGENQHTWRGFISLKDEPWLRDHKVGETVLLPAAGMLSMAIEAGRQLADTAKTLHSYRLREVSFFAALSLLENAPTEVIMTMRPHLVSTTTRQAASPWWEFSLSSSSGADRVRDHCRGLLAMDYKENRTEQINHEDASISNQKIADYSHVLRECQAHTYGKEDFYAHLDRLGFRYGENFRTVENICPGPGRSAFGVRILDIGETFSKGQTDMRPFLVHGATLDAFFQSWTSSTFYNGQIRSEKPYAPIFVGEMEVTADFPAPEGQLMPGFCLSEYRGPNELSASTFLFDPSLSKLHLSVNDFRISELDASVSAVDDQSSPSATPFHVRWDYALDVLQPGQAARILSDAAVTSQDCLLELVRMTLHENPAATVLEVVPDYASLPQAIIHTVRSNPGLPNGEALPVRVFYAIADIRDQKGFQEGDEKSYHGQPVALGLPGCALPENVPPASLLVIPPSASDLADAGNVLARSIDLAGTEATILLAANLPDAASVLEDKGFRRCLVFPGRKGSVEQYRRGPVKQSHETLGPEVIIIEPPTPTKSSEVFSKTLCNILAEHGQSVTRQSWTDAVTGNSIAGKSVLSLLELEEPFLQSQSPSDFARVKDLVLQTERLLWVTCSNQPSFHLVDGLARCIRNEITGTNFRILHLSEATGKENGPALAAYIATRDTEDKEFREVQGVLQAARVFPDLEGHKRVAGLLQASERMVSLHEQHVPLKLSIGRPGLLDTLCFITDEDMTGPLAENEVEVQVKAAGLNFKDVMAAMGMIPLLVLGSEASGIVLRTGDKVNRFVKGDRVAVLCPEGAHKTVLRVDERMAIKVPDTFSFEEAASILVVFITAYHALMNVAKLEKGQSILIHAAAGGVGQAAIQLALYLGLDIYVTAGSEEKRKFLAERYNIPSSHIFSSRDTSFSKGIARVTEGKGVDCVLNSLSGELLFASWNCVAPFGTFIELGLRDITDNTRLSMSQFRKNCCFTFFDIKDIPKNTLATILDRVVGLIRQGHISTVNPLTTYSFGQVKEAYRTMQQGKHYGKLILSLSGDVQVPLRLTVEQSLKLNPEATYLLIGGLGGLGRSLAQLFVTSGARNIAFISRSADTSPQAKELIAKLAGQGVNIRVFRGDIADRDSLLAALEQCSQELPRIRGVVHLAAVLCDGIFEKLSHEEWTSPLRPKVQGSWNLHEYFDHSRPLDFFILCASVSGIWGHASQSAYAAGNTYQDALAHYRRSGGLKATAVDLGIIQDVGMAAERNFGTQFELWKKVIGIPAPVFLAFMKSLINSQLEEAPGDDTVPAQVCLGVGSADAWAAHAVDPPLYLNDSRFRAVNTTQAASTASAGTQQMRNGDTSSLAHRLSQATTRKQAADIITEALVHKAAGILQIPTSEVDPFKALHEYGVDSLVAIEVRNWINSSMKANLALLEIMGGEPINEFATKIAQKSVLCNRALGKEDASSGELSEGGGN